jgi:lycopene beta-cyclase
MTYFGFLLRFLVIPILIFLVITWWDNRNNKLAFGFQNSRTVWWAIFVHVILAVVYTTPWDNYLVATGVWYYNPKLVTGILFGYVPIEEYTFFVLETILSGLWWWFLARRVSQTIHWFAVNKVIIYISTSIFTIAWIVFTIIFFSNNQPLTYLSITLFWALPPIILQLLYGADILWHHKKLVLTSILVPGIYLSIMDMYAIRDTTWSISPEQTTGILFFGILPLEEVVFFFVTNVLITFGITLLLAKESQSRLAYLKLLLQRSPNRESTSSN